MQKNDILRGLGDVIEQSKKSWVKDNLIKSLLFELSIRL